MKTVRKYEADDGKLFNTQQECINHELAEDAGHKLTAQLEVAIKTGRPAAVVGGIITEARMIRDILTDYLKRLRNEPTDPATEQEQRQAA
jgi:hypothetical protein